MSAGDLVVFRAFRPPFDEGRPVPRQDLDRVATTARRCLGAVSSIAIPPPRWTSPWASAGAGPRGRASHAAPPGALVLAVDLVESPLAVPWIAEVEGAVVARGPARHGLQWVNGAPRAGRQALLAIPLGGRSGGRVRLLFQGPGPRLRVTEVFLYGPDEAERPRSGQAAADRGLAAVRAGRWAEAVASYAEAVRAEPERASYHAALVRARWRAARRHRLDVEGLTDGGPEIALVR